MSTYAEYYKEKLEQGLEYQDFITELLMKELGLSISTYSSKIYQYKKGENRQGVEIKHDDRYRQTGNLYIETHEKAHPDNPGYVISGILRDDNTWLYVIGDYSNVFIFAKKYLVKLFNDNRTDVFRIVENNTKTSKGFLLSRKMAERYCIKYILIDESQEELFE